VADLFDQPLPPAVRQQLGRIRGAYIAHQKHPEMAKRAGKKGGLACVEANPSMKTSAHGRRLALSRRPRWELSEIERLLKESQ
jgi:hypothetical protein